MEAENLETVAPTLSPAIGIGAEPNFLRRNFAYLFAGASAVAILLVALPSIGCYAVAILFGKIPPLNVACRFLSCAYERLVARLGERILRDPRDTPALRLMLSVSLTAIPIFVVQILMGKPRLFLVLAFYLSLYGPKFQRFVRMFSAKHLEAHRRQGYFSDKYDKIFGRYIEFFLGYLYGNVPELDRTVHVRLHHKENSGPEDTNYTIGFDRTSRIDFLSFLADNTWTVLGIAPYAYFKSRGEEKYSKRMLSGILRYSIFFAAVFVYDWRTGIFYALVPLLCMNFTTAATAWVQHAFYDPEHPDDYFANTVTVMDEWNFMNEGYHLCHHHRSSLHWTDMPAHFEHLRAKMRDSGSLVFRDLDFCELFFELTLLRRMDVLAEKLVPWEPMSREERLALLLKRTQPAAPGLALSAGLTPESEGAIY